MSTPASKAAPIREAVASGEFQRAECLWKEYVSGLREELERGALTEAALEEMRELVEWSRVTLLCSRAHAQGRLGGLHIAGAYRNAPESCLPRLVHARL